jgi:hypothetical protein
MTSPERDRSADVLPDLDGQVLVVDPKGEYWVRFVVRRVKPSPERPHGLSYALALRGPAVPVQGRCHLDRGLLGRGGQAVEGEGSRLR